MHVFYLFLKHKEGSVRGSAMHGPGKKCDEIFCKQNFITTQNTHVAIPVLQNVNATTSSQSMLLKMQDAKPCQIPETHIDNPYVCDNVGDDKAKKRMTNVRHYRTIVFVPCLGESNNSTSSNHLFYVTS